MAKPDRLHELIHAMTKSEKRHFKVFAKSNASGKAQGYVQLFDLLAEMETFDLKLVESQSAWKSYPLAKKYLWEKILEALRVYHRRQVPADRIEGLIHQIETLTIKQLYDQAQSVVKKAKQLGYQAEEFHLLLKVLRQERKLMIMDDAHVFKEEKLLALNAEMKKALAAYELGETVSHIHYRFFAGLKTEKGDAGDQRSEALVEELKQLDVPSQPFFDHKISYYYVMNQFHLQQGNLPASFDAMQQIVSLFEAHPEKKGVNEAGYFSALHNYANRSMLVMEYGETMRSLKMLFQARSRNPANEARRVYSFSFISLGVVLSSGQLEGNAALLEFTENELEDSQYKAPLLFLFGGYSMMMIRYFIVEDYSAALVWLRKTLTDENHKNIMLFRHFLPVLEVIIHFELGNLIWVEDRLRTMFASPKSKDGYPLEKALLKHVKTLVKAADQEEASHLAEAFLPELKTLIQDPDGRKGSNLFDFESWVEARATGRSFQTVVQENWWKQGGIEVDFSYIGEEV